MSGSVNPDLQKERDTATFNVEEMTNILEGSKETTARRRRMEQMALSVKELATDPLDYYHMSREEQYNDGIRRLAAYLKDTKGITDREDLNYYKRIAFPHDVFPTGLHEGMFMVTLENQLSDEQKEKWLKKALNYEVIGTYAQTELGHGSHVRGLETTAVYDPQTEEFVINSPTLTSMKWWPGGLGKSSNMVLLMAQTYTQGISHGINPFLVQIRDLATHEPLPGVEVGDIGPKLGYDNMDNGFLKLNNIRIPRDQMLSRYVEVKKDGTFERKASNEKLTYGTMLWVRVMLVIRMGGVCLAAATTIATRYSAVRRQSEIQPGAPEPQILDYQTQQQKLFPLIATSYAFFLVGRSLHERHLIMTQQIMEGNTNMLPELHGLSCGLKAFGTYAGNWGVEQCRLACGGHGYSLASGLPKIFKVTSPGPTFEGENSIMYLQCARYLMKAFDQAHTNNPLGGSVAYLSQKNFDKCLLTAECSLDTLVAAFKFRATTRVREAGIKLATLRNEGVAQHEAWNRTAVQLTKAAEAHCHYYMVQVFAQTVNKLGELGASQPVVSVLTQLCQLFAVNLITQNAGDFMRDGFMTSEQLIMIENKALDLLSDIRPNAVALVDAFDFHDHTLSSVLGRSDGQVYENMYKWAQKSRLNDTQVHESYYKYLQPLKQSLSKL